MKSKSRGHLGGLVAQLRKTIGMSQSRFAIMVGVSKHTIISVENGRNRLTPKLARRIYAATGAQILDKNIRFEPISGVPNEPTPHQLTPQQSKFLRGRYDGTLEKENSYTLEDFKQWRDSFHLCNDETVRGHFDKIKTWIEFVFRAAANGNPAGNRDRFPAIYQSLVDWLNETRETFKLKNEIDQLLEEETRWLGESSFSISYLLEDPDHARDALSIRGFDYNEVKKLIKNRKPTDWIVMETEDRLQWDPFAGKKYCACEVRKLAPKPKIRFEDSASVQKRFFGSDYNPEDALKALENRA